MNDLLTTGGAGVGGSLLGALLAFLGLKTRIDAAEKKICTLNNNVVYEATCQARHHGFEQRFDDQAELLKEVRTDIKSILREIKR